MENLWARASLGPEASGGFAEVMTLERWLNGEKETLLWII